MRRSFDVLGAGALRTEAGELRCLEQKKKEQKQEQGEHNIHKNSQVLGAVAGRTIAGVLRC